MARMCNNSNRGLTVATNLLLITISLSVAVLASSVSTGENSSKSSGKFCPKICTCDVIEDLKRADCSNEKLINTYTDVPYDVEILDLSINIISSIENENFMHYDNLVKLFLSENSIQTISLDAFANQQRLTTLDLSYNRLEQLNEQLFERNLQLVDLNLSGNNFMMLPNAPFLKSYSIMFLHLSNCRIPHVFDTMFIDLPNLQSLDLSKNIMNSLATVPFAHLRKLTSINLLDNRWDCKTESARNTVRWLKTRVPATIVDSCLLSDLSYSGNRFERIMEDPTLNDKKQNRHDIAIEEVWGTQRSPLPKSTGEDLLPSFMNKTCSYTDLEHNPSTEPCELFVECQRKYTELYHAHKLLLSRTNTRCNEYFRTGVFVGGALVGLMLGSFLTYTVCWAVRSCRKRSIRKKANYAPDQRSLHRELRREIRGRNQFEHTRLNESPIFTRSDRVPGTVRASQDDEIYQNHEHTRQFLVNLFSKRQHRYVRSNSQLANINNRYIPPTQTRDEPREVSNVVLRDDSDPERLWEHQFDSNYHEQVRMPMVDEPDASFRLSADQQPTWISIRPNGHGTLTRSPRTRKDVATSGESPPPPYIECTLDTEPKQETVNMY